MEAVQSVDVFSPNHIELLSLFGYPEVDFRKELVEELAFKMLEGGVGPQGKGVVVVRAAEHGCLVTSRSISPVWLPPFYGARDIKIVDTTGAGNAFLGGLVIGHSETGDFVKAAQYGSVAASFLVEQIGVPILEKANVSRREDLWNGEVPRQRLELYASRLTGEEFKPTLLHRRDSQIIELDD